MAANFLFVSQQVLLLGAIILTGFIVSRAGLVSDEGESAISALAMYVATPAVVISALQRPFEATLWSGLKQAALIVMLSFFFLVLATRLTIRHPDTGYRSVMRFAAIFANVGYMCLPLVEALYGDTGVFYCSAVIALFNMQVWTYGYILMSAGSGKQFPLRKIVLNPGVLSAMVGITLFLTSTTLPSGINSFLGSLSALNTPLGMIVIGCRLAHSDIRATLKSGAAWISTAERLVIFPLLLVGALYLCGVRGTPAMVAVITACAPAASMTTMLAVHFHHDESAAANTVSLQTALSIITMPLVVSLGQHLLLS